MKFFPLAILAFLVLIFTFSVFAQDETRATATWQVQKYNVSAILPQTDSDRNLSVKAILTLKNVSNRPAQTLTLRINQNASFSVVKINDSTADFTKGEEKIGTGNLQKIVVRIPSVQPNAIISAALDYKLNIKENSGLNALSPKSSQFLPLSFWYPTPNSWFFARGADFAPFSLQVTASNGETVVSSGVQNGNNFEQKLNGQPFFITGNWEVVNSNNVSVYVPKGSNLDEQKRANELASLVSDAKSFTADLLGNIPDEPIKIVAVKRGAGFSGAGTIFVEQGVFQRQKIDSQTAMTIAESIAKLWLGNEALVSGDGYGVIREGLSRYIATQFLEKEFGKDVADIERLRQRTSYVSVVGRDAPLSAVSPLDDFYYAEVANKGAMIWRLLAKRLGQNEFFSAVRSQIKAGNLNLADLRATLPTQKEFLDYSFDQVTDTNLLIGLPQVTGAETKIALRNTGSFETTVNVSATTSNGEKLNVQTTIPPKSFGEAIFKTANKIVRNEVDTEKLYPQTDYSDDIAPREIDSSDPILFIKRAFDQQDYAKAEKNARIVLQDIPHFDDARVWLGRALLAESKISDAEKEFHTVLAEKLPTARSLAWATVGLGEISVKAGQPTQAQKYFEDAILDDAEYGATFAAREGRNKLSISTATDDSIKAFFAQFDKAVVSGRKADVDALIVPGEISRFSSGVTGAQQWQTKVLQIDKIDADNDLVETNLNIKLLNKDPETGTAVFRVTRIGNIWKLNSVDIFETK